MKKIFLAVFIALSITSLAQNKYYDVQRIDSLYGTFNSGSSTDSVVTVDANGKFFKRNASAFGISGITADNGLTASTSTNVRLGGTLLQNTTINTGGFQTTFTGANTSPSISVVNTGTGSGISSVISGTGSVYAVFGQTTSAYGIAGDATSGIAVYGTATTGIAGSFSVMPSSTNTVVNVARISRFSSGSAANGIGGSIEFVNEESSGSGNISNQLISKWTDVTTGTRTSQFIITGVTSGTTQDWFTIGQSGYVQLRGMNVTEAGAITAANGMILYITNTDATFTSVGFWGRENGAWVKL